jgi:hypothetical protein
MDDPSSASNKHKRKRGRKPKASPPSPDRISPSPSVAPAPAGRCGRKPRRHEALADADATRPPSPPRRGEPKPVANGGDVSPQLPVRGRDRRSMQRTSPVCSQPPATRWCRSSLLRRADTMKLSSRPTTPVSCKHVVLLCWPVAAVSLVMLQLCCPSIYVQTFETLNYVNMELN